MAHDSRPVAHLVCLLSLAAALPARAVDLVPFAGLRFGGSLSTTTTNATAPSSLSIDSAASYGGVVDVPLWGPRSLELYYSRQPTTISGGSAFTPPLHDATVSVLQLGLVDAIPTEDPRLSWLLAGTLGATELQAAGSSVTDFSIGLGGGMLWMANEHFGLRGDLRALITFTGSSASAISCGGGCTFSFHSNAVIQGEASVGIVLRFR
jgi:hypothetical protein